MRSINNEQNRREYSPWVSALVDQFVPEHIQSNYPNLIEFIKAYLDFLEETHGSGYFQNTLPAQRDIETQEEQFLRRIEQEIGLFVPREYEATPRLFYNKISELWRAKGSTEAIETFFRLFLNDTVEVRYPWDLVLKPSDGRWNAPSKIRVSMISGNPDDFVSERIQQLEEYGFATVTKVERKVYADQTIHEMTIISSETVGDFKPGNRIANRDQTAVAEIYRSVTNVLIINPGTNYRIGDRVRLKGLSRISFEARVSGVDSVTGGITGISILDFGSGTTPRHLFDPDGDDRYFLDGFGVFQYLDENRQLDLADNIGITEDSFEGFSQNYTSGSYFSQSYVGVQAFGESQDSLIDSPLDVSDIEVTPADNTGALNFEVDSRNGSGAEFALEFGPIVKSAGYYDGVRGQLSEAIVLQDSEFYQKFSYEIVTAYPIDVWIEPVKTHVSPAGTKAFGLINRSQKIGLSTSILTEIKPIIAPISGSFASGEIVKDVTKSLAEPARTADNVVNEVTKSLADASRASDSGVIFSQDYVNGAYFSSDYAGSSTTF